MKRKALAIVTAIGILLTTSISYAAYSFGSDDFNVVNPALLSPQAIKIDDSLARTLFQGSVAASGFRYYGDQLLTKANSIDSSGLPDTTNDDIIITFQSSTSNILSTLSSTGDSTPVFVDFVLSFPNMSNPSSHLSTMVSNGHFTIDYPLFGGKGTMEFPLYDLVNLPTMAVSFDNTQKSITAHYLINETGAYNNYHYISLMEVYLGDSGFTIMAGSKIRLYMDFDLSKESNLSFRDFKDMTLSIEVNKL